ncbi:hypothetical protein P3T18_003685 [Paraburkholderia sp. GAS199]
MMFPGANSTLLRSSIEGRRGESTANLRGQWALKKEKALQALPARPSMSNAGRRLHGPHGTLPAPPQPNPKLFCKAGAHFTHAW